MKVILSLTLLVFITVSSAHASASDPLKLKSGQSLYQKLHNMFISSTTPFDIEKLAITNESAASPFQGCAYAEDNGKTGQKIVIPLFVSITKDEDLGPISPPKKNVALAVSTPDFVSQYLIGNGARFENGVLDLDPIVNWTSDTIAECKVRTTVKEYYQHLSSSLSADKTSYEIRNNCSDDSQWSGYRLRLVSEYLVAESTDGEVPSHYFYCW